MTHNVYWKDPVHVIYEQIRQARVEEMSITAGFSEEYSDPMNSIVGRKPVPKADEIIEMDRKTTLTGVHYTLIMRSMQSDALNCFLTTFKPLSVPVLLYCTQCTKQLEISVGDPDESTLLSIGLFLRM